MSDCADVWRILSERGETEMHELVCPGCGYRGEDFGWSDWITVEHGRYRQYVCPVCDGQFAFKDCTQERYDAVTAELERRTLHTRRLERVASPAIE